MHPSVSQGNHKEIEQRKKKSDCSFDSGSKTSTLSLSLSFLFLFFCHSFLVHIAFHLLPFLSKYNDFFTSAVT